DPLHPQPNSVFLPERPFPNSLTWTWSQTKGADLMWAPIGFEHSFRMAYSRTHYGTGYFIYQQYIPGAKLSRPIRAWNESVRPDQDVLELINRSGSRLVPPADSAAGRKLRLREQKGRGSLGTNETSTILELFDSRS